MDFLKRNSLSFKFFTFFFTLLFSLSLLGLQSRFEKEAKVMASEEVEISILNPSSHPNQGEHWTVRFETKGTADLIIKPLDQPTIDDLDFVTLKCGNEERTPEILENDVIFYSSWQCKNQEASVSHLVNHEWQHELRFDFGKQTASAHNWSDLGGGDHGGADWTINTDTNIAGEHTNVGAFTVNDEITATVSTGVALSVEATTAGIVGTINGDGKGYAKDQGPGAGGASQGGGYGGDGGGNSDSTYGSPTQPTDMGSGGGTGGGGAAGGRGGGQIKLSVTNTITVNGTITSNGNAGAEETYEYSRSGGGGAGGSIYITTGSITGSGSIRANGGNGGPHNHGREGNSGAGGRISIHYTTTDTFNGTKYAYGGTVGSCGGAGTIFTKDGSQTNGDLRMDNNGTSGAATSLVDGTYTFDNITSENSANLTLSSGDTVTTDNLTIQNTGYLTTSGSLTVNTTFTDTSGTFTLSNGTTTLLPSTSIPSGFIFTYNGGTLSNITTLTIAGTFYLNTSYSTPNVTIQSGGNLTHSTGDSDFDLTVTNNLIVDPGGNINTNGGGYGTDSGPGAGGASQGGGYGGDGGGNSDSTYGSPTQPTDMGSGGGTGGGGAAGGRGGGQIKLSVTNTITVNGTITSNGNAGAEETYEYSRSGGGGAGGSIYITTGSITGSGSIRANGGNGGPHNHGREGSGGGGGRIAIYYDTTTYSETPTATGGTGHLAGEEGTVVIQLNNTAPSDPTIDNYNDGAWITDNTPTLQFDLSDPDTDDIVKYQLQIDNDSDFGSTIVDYTEPSGDTDPRNNVQYTPSALDDGSYYWRVKAIDDSSAESSWTTANSGSIAFKVDATAPTGGSISIDSGATYATSTSVTLTISAIDATSGLNQMMVSEDSGFSGASWESYSTSKALTLSSTNGTKTVYIKFNDNAGNASSAVSDTIVLDTVAPTGGSVSVDGGASYATSTSVTLTLSASDATSGMNQMMVSEDSGFSGASWVSYATSSSFTLSSGDGSKTVYAKFRDNATNATSAVSDIIILDGTAPVSGSVSINSDDNYTASTNVTLTLSASDATSGLSQMMVSEDSGFAGASWETYDTSKSFSLSSGDGEKTVYAKFKDNAGNESAAITDTITVDSTSPLNFTLNNYDHQTYTTNQRPTFKWIAASTTDTTSGLEKYQLDVDNGNSGDFTIDNIPVSRTEDLEENRYYIRYDNFADNDQTNNAISIYTKSSSGWNDGDNDGQLKEGKRTWTVIAYDQAGNYRDHGRTLFVDLSNPVVNVIQVNDNPFNSASIYTTIDQTPTIQGTIIDPLAGDKEENYVASGPQQLEIRVEKKNSLGIYELDSLTTLNFTKIYWSDTGEEITDNTQQKADKYTSFSFTPSPALVLGEYRLILTAKDEVGHSNYSQPIINLKVVSSQEIVTPEQEKLIKETIKEEYPKLSEEEKVKLEEEVKEQIEAAQKEEPQGFPFLDSISQSTRQRIFGVRSFLTNILYFFKEVAISGNQALAQSLKQPKQFTSKFGQWLSYSCSAFKDIILDQEPTKITDVKVEEVGTDYAIITWKTNHHATSKVNYGFTYDYGETVQTTDKVKHHRLKITNLNPATKYSYEVMSQNKNYVFDARHEFNTLLEEK